MLPSANMIVPVQAVQDATIPISRYQWQYQGTSHGQTRWMDMSSDFNFTLECLYNEYRRQQSTLPANEVQHVFTHMYFGNQRRGNMIYTVDFINHVQRNDWGESFRIRKIGIAVVFGPAD